MELTRHLGPAVSGAVGIAIGVVFARSCIAPGSWTTVEHRHVTVVAPTTSHIASGVDAAAANLSTAEEPRVVSGSASSPTSLPPSQADLEAEAERAAASLAQRCDSLVAGGFRDATRETEARATLEQTASVLDSQVRVMSVACANSLCRIELEHGDESSAHSLIRQLWGQPAFAGAGMTRRRSVGDGSYVTVYYVAQDGTDLPRAADEEAGAL